MQRTKDHDIRVFAETISSIIVTKDEDFVALNLRAGNGPPVIWVRYGNLRNRSLLEKFGAALPSPVKQIEAGEAVIELI